MLQWHQRGRQIPIKLKSDSVFLSSLHQFVEDIHRYEAYSQSILGKMCLERYLILSRHSVLGETCMIMDLIVYSKQHHRLGPLDIKILRYESKSQSPGPPPPWASLLSRYLVCSPLAIYTAFAASRKQRAVPMRTPFIVKTRQASRELNQP